MAEVALTPLPAIRSESVSAVARLLALLVPLGLLGGALLSEHVGGLWPCEMCWWQRYPHGVAILLAAAAFFIPAESRNARLLVGMAALAIAISGAIGVYHTGVEERIFKGFTSCTAMSGGGSTEEVLKQIMNVPLIQCDQVQWRFLGLSLAAWNAVISLPSALLIGWLLRQRRPA